MKGEEIELTQRQLQRFQVLGLVEVGEITLKEAAAKIGLSYRQTKRIRKGVKEKGIKGVIHGNTGKASNHRTDEGVYSEFNDTHFIEKSVKREGMIRSRETVRTIGSR